MFDVTALKERLYEIRIADEQGSLVDLQVYAPTKSEMSHLTSLMKDPDSINTDELYNMVHTIMNHNKQHIVVPESLTSAMSFDVIIAILFDYYEWVADTRAEKN